MIKFEFSRSMSESQKQTEVVEILKHLKLQDSEAYTQFCDMVDLAQIIIDLEEKHEQYMKDKANTECIMPECPYCQGCPYGFIYQNEDWEEDRTEWICTYKGEKEEQNND